ncbi:hypothetical protein DPEC_G00257500 [Dallia pectoralis]|uniref:Uncharacterized protein n=1 Tax=Dallia pectoralis TaxID=75939 RepID=A0ACC2FR48_DALPE|nr:hypothetical protein DPEC_G00257500 [Dallia pectoralis]
MLAFSFPLLMSQVGCLKGNRSPGSSDHRMTTTLVNVCRLCSPSHTPSFHLSLPFSLSNAPFSPPTFLFGTAGAPSNDTSLGISGLADDCKIPQKFADEPEACFSANI